MKILTRCLAIATFAVTIGALSAHAAFTCTSDTQGADDEPGQKDLSEYCDELGDASPYELNVTWNFDDTLWNGNNSGDACVLFDTNGNGFADWALCVSTTGGSPATQKAGSPRLFSCGDDRPDRCSSAVEDTDGFSSTCTVNSPGEDVDPFSGVPGHAANKCAGTDCPTEDTFVSCRLDGADVPGTESCVMGHCSNIPAQLCAGDGDCLPITDVCSFPSAQPNSDPSDCIVTATAQDPCLGVDCTHLDDDCNVGVCDSETGMCEADPKAMGTACGDPSSGVCDSPDTCDGAGTCQPNYASSETLCRMAVGACDLDDYCAGDSAECLDDVMTGGTVCRPSAGVCDVPESCDGASGSCPADGFKSSTVVCRTGSGDLCDPNETCTGSSATCPGDTIAAPGSVCDPGSGDACDPDEVCSGVAGETCPVDSYASAMTVCRTGSGDLCDPNETCPGVPDQGCPADTVANPGTVCNAGSGDACDPDEVCSGEAGEACPTDSYASAATVCRQGSGDLCDPDETCPGVADQGCPADTVANPGTVCNAGSGDACDPDEICSGEAGEPCPMDSIATAGTVCNPGSGDACDPDEVCSGVADEGCPTDSYASAETVCNPGSGDFCDPDETCPGVPDQGCPADTVTTVGTVCNPGSGDACDPDEVCSGVADEPCPDDAYASAETVCRAATDVCDVTEYCPGTADAGCPADDVAPTSTTCRESAGICDLPEQCDGVTKACPADVLKPAGALCRADMGDCDVPEQCTGSSASCPADAKEPAGTACTDEGNVCTDDVCDAYGTCTHPPNDDPCNDYDQCTVGEQCVDGRCVGDVVCEPICRTPGFWGQRGGDEKDGQNVTQGVIDAAPGGALSVCGQSISSTIPVGRLSSALEAVCISPRGSSRLQLYRQLTSTALNCVLSDDPTCALVLPVYAECDALCASGESSAFGVSIGTCIQQLDCFNNGGRWVPGMGCAAGECETEFFLFCGGPFGSCPNVEGQPQACVPFGNSCHEQPLCPSAELCFEPLGPTSSTSACRRARSNSCTLEGCD